MELNSPLSTFHFQLFPGGVAVLAVVITGVVGAYVFAFYAPAFGPLVFVFV